MTPSDPRPDNHPITRQTTTRHIPPSSSNSSSIPTHSPTPTILAAGLWRTGTSSLQIAFETHLNLTPCLHGGDIVTNIENLKLFYACCVEEDDKVRRRLLMRLIGEGGWAAMTDLPGWAFVEDLVVIYPEIRLLLNKRPTATSWVVSVNSSLRFYSTMRYFLIGYFDPYLYWHHRMYIGLLHLLRRRHGVTSVSEIFTTRTYEAHNEWVRGVAARYGTPILEYEVSEGWRPLVQFLGVDVPKGRDGEVVEFPRINEAEGMKELKKFLVRKGLMAWVRRAIGPLVAGIVLVVGILWWR